MEEKKIVFKSIDEQLAEDEARQTAAKRPTEKGAVKSSAVNASGKAVSRASSGAKKGKRKLRLKKSARRTIGSLLLATSIVVGAIPVGGVSADTPAADPSYWGNTTDALPLASISSYGTAPAGEPTGSPSDTYTGPANTNFYAMRIKAPAGATKVGGFPLKIEDGTKFTPKLVTYGEAQFFEVDKDGYNSVKPAYVLGKETGASQPHYLIDYIGDDLNCYSPPGGNLNLVAGYVKTDDKPYHDGKYYWEKEEGGKYYLYRLTLEKTSVTGHGDLYAKKLEKFGQFGDFHTCRFFSSDDTTKIPWRTLSIEHGKTITSVPDGHDLDDATKTFLYWLPGTSDPINSDVDFIPIFEPKTTPSRGESGEEGGEADGQANNASEPEGENNALSPSENESSNNNGSGTEEAGEEPSAPNSENENAQNNTNSESGSNETVNPDGSITVNVESEHADAGGFGLTGVLLAKFDPSEFKGDGYDFHITKEYDDSVLESHYVCDYFSDYEQLTDICDGAFKGVSTINHVSIPDKLERIGNEVFMNCEGLLDAVFGERLEKIGVSSFEGTAALGHVYYKNSVGLTTIGAKAFAESGIKKFTMDPSEPVQEFVHNNFTIPHSVTAIGNAAFYNGKMSDDKNGSIDFPETVSCKLGDYVFANCDSITKIDLTPKDFTNTNLSGLTTPAGLFAGCDALKSVIMTPSLDGMLMAGTFGNCTKMEYIKFQSNAGFFANNEFDKRQITVEGPKPDSLDPTNASNPKAYNTALGGGETDTGKDTSGKFKNNDYVYRYHNDAGVQFEAVNQIAYSGIDFPKYFDTDIDERTGGKFAYVFEIEEPNGISNDIVNNSITKQFYRSSAATTDIEIGNRFGRRYHPERGQGYIYAGSIGKDDMDKGLFEGDGTITRLKVTGLNRISKNSFKKSTKLDRLWAVCNATDFRDGAFSEISTLKKVTFEQGDGNSGSYIRTKCFAETSNLNNVDFIDDNLEDGDKNKYAIFLYDSDPAKNAIATDAFLTNARTKEIIFKGPMLENYAPYRFAIDPVSKISGTKQVYPYYFSGNPQNLTAQYIVNGTKRVDPADGKEKDCSGVFLLYYPNMSSYVGDKADGLNELEDLQLKRKKDGQQINDFEKERKAHGDLSISTMKREAIECATTNFVVPYGINYLEKAVSMRNVVAPATGLTEYRVFDDATNLYYNTPKDVTSGNFDNTKYQIFKYNPDLVKVTFSAGGVDRFPDRMFEGAINLEEVYFEGDVKELGKLPFYLPDTEADATKTGITEYQPDSFPHEGAGTRTEEDFRSHIDTVLFNEQAEELGGASASNEDYTSKHFSNDKSFAGIIESKDGKNQKLVQIVPSRGDFVGSTDITSDELEGTNLYLEYAARDCDEITSVDFPDERIEIQTGCFMDCDKLNKVYMPDAFASIGDESFGYIYSNMDVTFPQNEVNINAFPFHSAAKDGKSQPLVTFHVHKDAETLLDYADKNLNINTEFIADTISLIYKGSAESADPTYQVTIPAQADGKTYGISYAPDEDDWPLSKKGSKPTDWIGQEIKSGNVVKWKSTPLSADTIFTPVYGEGDSVYVLFYLDDDHKDLLKKVEVIKGATFTKDMLPSVPEIPGKKFLGWKNDPTGNEINEEWIASAWWYDPGSSSTSSSTSTTSSTGGSTSTSGGSTSKSSSSSSKSSSSSSSSSSAYPVYVSSQDTIASMPVAVSPGVGSTVYIDEGSGSSGSDSGSGSGNGRKGSGNASVISTTGGISDTGKISATVNGSSDNYVIKITQTQEADEMGLMALHGAYGDDLTPIRYLPFDISLYDSTGTNKISPVPEGVSVSITMPIPDDLAIYGGNAKIASTAGGVLDKMTPRFTVINGVPCMTYTCTHFSPYLVWVDTANLTEAGISDMTPKTADGIHPKWFLCFGLAAMAVVMFLKKDPEEYLKKAA